MTQSHSIGQAATLACLLEVTAPKPGNVHRGADFEDCTFIDFLASAVAIGPVMDAASGTSLGETVLASVAATRKVTVANTNLGIVLLLSPLAAASGSANMRADLSNVLSHLTPKDSENVYAAIRLARPGGMDAAPPNAESMDVDGPAPEDLLAAMQVAASYDMIAQQYTKHFEDVFDTVVPCLVDRPKLSLTSRIIATHLRLMSEFPDSLIRRKCGSAVAAESAFRAKRVLDSGSIDSDSYNAALADFDFWLRSDGNRRNPGTTADLIAAGLFVAIRENRIRPPFH